MPQYHASGTFTVKMTPQDTAADAAPTPGATLGRLLLDKHYQGDLQATAQGQMLSAVTPTSGSAGYVAIEHVTGTLHGRSGSFLLQHSGLMSRGNKQLTVTVVPDSGTDGLLGLEGRLDIRIAEGQHCYDFDCTLP
ncbi:MAG: DUF3224 domain-containing protein [Rubrivivax sp.]|nr:DUF3224 domain-containing protein [Rubrivivax sp.]MDP3616189.1 DUF3224 domain-containing protein [Rubrivivax sp.]